MRHDPVLLDRSPADPALDPSAWPQSIEQVRVSGLVEDDLVGVAQAVRAGRLLSAELTEQFLTPQVLHHERDDGAVWYGFGLEFVIDENGTVRNTYKDGVNAGASGIVRYYPIDQFDVAVLSNSADGAWPPTGRIHPAGTILRSSCANWRLPSVGPATVVRLPAG
jgi:hypothetical protein